MNEKVNSLRVFLVPMNFDTKFLRNLIIFVTNAISFTIINNP